jgi:hypothetical protein
LEGHGGATSIIVIFITVVKDVVSKVIGDIILVIYQASASISKDWNFISNNHVNTVSLVVVAEGVVETNGA